MRKNFFYFLIFIFLGFIGFANSVEIRVNSTKIAPGDRLEVKIIAVGEDVKFPKFDNIDGVLIENLKFSKKLQTQIQIVDNKIEKKTEKIISFSLYPDKNITIPSFNVEIDGKTYQTKPMQIEVIKEKKGRSLTNRFSIKTSVNKKVIYLGEPIIFTVEMFAPEKIVSNQAPTLEYIAPEFKDFFIKPPKNKEEFNKDGFYITRLKYILTPQKAGSILIPPANFKVGLQDPTAPSDPFGLFTAPMKWYMMRSKPIKIEVKQTPKDIDLVGDFKISANINKNNLKINEPVDYTLKIEGRGVLDDLEDPVFDIPGVTVYSKGAKTQSKIVGDKVYSTYTKKYVFISDRSFTIPPITLKEFDYFTNTTKNIQTKAFDITVGGSGGFSAPMANSPQNTNSPRNYNINSNPNTPDSVLEDSVYYAKKEYEEKASMLPFYTLAAFLAGMMAMFALMKLLKKSKRVQNFIKKEKRVLKDYTTKEALDLLYPYTSDSPEVEDMVKRLYLVSKGKRALHTIDKDKLNKILRKYENIASKSE